jgi:hypothetical protein
MVLNAALNIELNTALNIGIHTMPHSVLRTMANSVLNTMPKSVLNAALSAVISDAVWSLQRLIQSACLDITRCFTPTARADVPTLRAGGAAYGCANHVCT